MPDDPDTPSTAGMGGRYDVDRAVNSPRSTRRSSSSLIFSTRASLSDRCKASRRIVSEIDFAACDSLVRRKILVAGCERIASASWPYRLSSWLRPSVGRHGRRWAKMRRGPFAEERILVDAIGKPRRRQGEGFPSTCQYAFPAVFGLPQNVR